MPQKSISGKTLGKKKLKCERKVLLPLRKRGYISLILANNYGASQLCYEHPWCSESDASPVLFLPRLVGEFLDDDGVAYRHELMDLLPMQALAMSRQLAFLGGLPASHLLVGFAAFPVQLLLASLLDAPLLVVVVGIGGAPLSLHLALEPADVLLIRG